MAQKRMFDKSVVNQDSFYDLPMEAKALYFLMGMEADDDGFVTPKKVLRLYGGTEDSIKLLIAKGYVIPFNSGVVVITDWRRNNWLDNRRKIDTIYQYEKSTLTYDEKSQKYVCLANAKRMLGENSIVENSIVENSIVENSIVENSIDSPKDTDVDICDDPIDSIINYLNYKVKTKYNTKTKSYRESINARLNDGYTIKDCKKVIDIKCDDWLNTDYSKYLNPITLFRPSNFDKYLNQKEHIKTMEELMENINVDEVL